MSPAMLTFQKEKEAYWQLRDELLKTHLQQWVAIADGKVVAAGDSADDALAMAYQRVGPRPLYINKVGTEETASRKKIRQIESARYSTDYDPPMPMLTIEITNPKMTERTRVNFILDTGADISVLQEDVCAGLGLGDFLAEEALVTGIGESWEPWTLYAASITLLRRRITTDC